MLKQINVEQLRVGMFIQKFCSTWDESPFWRTSLLLDNLKDLHAIQASDVAQVWIDTSKGLDIAKPVVENEVATQIIAPLPLIVPRRASFDDEMARAKKICADGKIAVTTMFQEARMGNALNTAQAHTLVEEISSSVMRNPDALISLARLKNKDDYTYMHSVAVCALMIALARKMKLDDRQIRDAGLAGLLHDVGKMMVSQSILDKPGQLTDEEFVAVKEHPVEGHKILSVSPDVSEAALDVCLHHHERFDGTGYPHRLAGENISLFARMGAVCDVYDAITSNRAYKAGWEPSESLRRMAEWKGHFDPAVFQAFVKCIGIYPTGALVRLKTGRIGVVVEQSENSLLTPKVKIFFSVKSNAYIPPELVDLAKLEGYDKIIGLEDAQKLGLKNVHVIWEGVA